MPADATFGQRIGCVGAAGVLRAGMGRAALVAALVAAASGCHNSASCGQPLACPNGQGSYWLCSASDGCYYLASDGSRFTCSCGACDAARALALTWCGSAPVPDAASLDTCSPTRQYCGSAGAIYFCSNAAFTECHYLLGDGRTFACASCGNCTDAATQATQACQADLAAPANCATAPSQQACSACCAQQHPAGFQIVQQAVRPCVCSNCGTCASAFICGGTLPVGGACSTCEGMVQTGAGSCAAVTAQCNANSDCTAFIACERPCPTN
jgi:hypothetical protein